MLCIAQERASLGHAWKSTRYFFVFVLVVTSADLISDTASIRLKLWSSNHEKCTTDTTHCVPITPNSNRTCLGNRLPYEFTAPNPLVEDVSRYDLELWTALRSIPACWDKLQFFLCSVYVPECIDSVQHTSVNLPTNPISTLNHSTTTILNAALAPLGLLKPPTRSDEKSSGASSKTNPTTARVVLPEAEMCEAVHKACPLLVPILRTRPDQAEAQADSPVRNPTLLLHPLPRFLDCSLYTPGCRQNKLTAQLFRSSGGGCEAPLITTTVRRNWLNEIERCSFPCRRPHFDDEHYYLARWITGTATIVCILVNLAVLATLKLQNSEQVSLMDQFAAYHPPAESGFDLFRLMVQPSEHKCARSHHTTKVMLTSASGSGTSRFPWTSLSTTYPALFCIHVCFLVGCLAWLIPLFPGWGELIACREDGSVRTGEPQVSSGKTVLCVLDFILLYFPLMSVCVWSNVLDYTLVCRVRQVIQHLHVTLETLGTPSRLSCPKKRTTLVPATDLAFMEPSSRHFSQDNSDPNGRDRSSIRQSSRHRREKNDEFSDSRPTPILSRHSSVTHQHHQKQQEQQTDDLAKSPVDTSESTSTAPLAGSTATQAETSLSQSISESSPSGADIVAVSSHSVDQVASHSRSDSKKLHTSRRNPFKSNVMPNATVWRADNHRGSSGSRKKHKKPRTASAGGDDELILLSQFSSDKHLYDSQWSIVDQHYRSLLISLTDNNPLELVTQEPHGVPPGVTGFELRTGDCSAGPSLQCSFCHDPLCPSVPHPLTFHAISSALQLKTRSFQSRCDRHTHSSSRKHGSSKLDSASGCPACVVAERQNVTGLDTIRTHQVHPLQSSPQSACLHLLAFALPLVLTLICLTAAEIDGDALAGICFVGRVNVWARIGLVLVPCAICLIVKCVYLGQVMRLCMRLRRPFLRSPFPSDQEFAQRLVRCTYSYGVFLFVLVGLWLFSVSVQTYTFVGEPVWLESQTALILCQISHRLMGLDSEAARTACVDSTSTDKSKSSTGLYHPPNQPEGDRIARDGVGSEVRTARSLIASRLPTASPDPTVMENDPLLFGRLNLYSQRSAPIHKPVTGPILLHLLTYFVLNVIFASMCLLDSSVKRSWHKCWIRFRVSCRLGRWQGQLPGRRKGSHAHAINKLLTHCLYGNPVGFSWWDPGLFSIPLLQDDSPVTGSSAKETSSTCELVPLVDMVSGIDLKHCSFGPGERSITTDLPSLSKVPADVVGISEGTDQPAISEFVKRAVVAETTEPSVLPSSQLPAVVTPFDDLLPHVARVISLYETTAPEHPTLVFFRHLYDQLMHPGFEQPPSDTLNQHASSLLDQLTAAANTASEVGVEGSQPSQSNLMASMAALYDQCQKHLVAVNNPSTRHRSRHRRLLPTRASVRRKSHSRSLSTSGLCIPSSSLRVSGIDAGGGANTCAGSTVSAESSDKTESMMEESLPELLRAAASVLAAAATGSSHDPARIETANDGRRRHRRLSQSVLSASISMQRSNQSSGVTSAFGGSQVSSSSVRSALTELHGPVAPAVLTDTNTSVHDHRLAGKSIAPRPTGEERGTLGSRMSLRSLSCASSSGAESYNSYRLLVNQAGASWRELWRTRMLLMDVLRWAEAVAPLAQANGTLNATPGTTATQPTEPITYNPPPQSSDLIDWNARFASFLAAALLPIRPEQPCSGTMATSEALIPPPIVTTAQQHVGSPKVSDLTGGLASTASMSTMDPMMAAAFAAATAAAATVAMQQQQQQQHFPTAKAHSLSSASGLGSSPQAQIGPSQFMMPQHHSPFPVNPSVSTQYDQLNEYSCSPSMAFKSPYGVPRSHQNTPKGSMTAGPMHATQLGPYTAYPFEWSSPVTPRFQPLSPPTYGVPNPYIHSSYGPGVVFRHPSLLGAPWPHTGAVVYPRQTLSAPDRMIHQYTPTGLDEDWHLSSGRSIGRRGPPDLLLDHARIPGGTTSGPQISHYAPSCTNSRIDPIIYLPPPPPNQQHLFSFGSFVPHPISAASVLTQVYPRTTGEIAHSAGSHSLPLLRPDRNTALTGRSSTHPLLTTVPTLLTQPTKPTLSDNRASKSPGSPSPVPDRDPADSDAFDSEDEVMSDEDQVVSSTDQPEIHAVNQPPLVATFVPFSPMPPNSAAYFLPPFHNLPHGSDPTMEYLCAQPPVALIRPSPSAYSPTPLDDGDVSSVSQSASQVPPRPSSNSSSSGSCSPGADERQSPVALKNANAPNDKHNT